MNETGHGYFEYLIQTSLTDTALQAASKDRRLAIRFEVAEALPAGPALYGERFSRFPLDPTFVFTLRK